jgi:ATP/maltotriose-dependent transcriptional regulator MalT
MAVDWQVTAIHYLRGRLDQALEMAQSVLARNEQFGELYLPCQADMLFVMAMTHAIWRDYAQAHRCFDRLLEQVKLTPMAEPIMISYLYARGRTYWLQGRLEEARQVCDHMAALEARGQFSAGPVLLPMMYGLLALGERRFAAAEGHLQEAAGLEPKMPFARLFGSPRVLLAHLFMADGRPRQALGVLGPVLAEYEQGDVGGLIMQEGEVVIPLLRLAARRGLHAPFAVRLLDLLGMPDVPRAIRIPETGETLTPREVEVLGVIASGATNRAVAEQLSITLPTVKSHITHILRKLNVTSRYEAADRARELGIVGK